MAGTPGVAAKVFNALGSAERQRARDRAGRVRAQHLRGRRRQATRRARCAPCTPASTCRRTRSRSASSGRARSAACCSISSRRRARGCASEFKLDLRVRGILSVASACCWRTPASTLARWREQFEARPAPADLDELRRARARRPPAAHGDHRLHGERGRRPSTTRTGSRAGIHVVTPNKKANSADARLTTAACTRRAAPAARTTSTRPRWARACR